MAEITYSSEPLEAVFYHARSGEADVYLRKNFSTEIVEDDEGNCATVYYADEVYGVSNQPKSWFEENFDQAWDIFNRASMSSAARIADLETQIEEQAYAINELAIIMVGGE